MPNRFLSPDSPHTATALALIRILLGAFMIYHGKEIFEPQKMNDYIKWFTDAKMMAPAAMAYTGKGCEFIAGILLVVGFLTRLAAIISLVTFLLITFHVGEGRIFMEEQHPFMFCIFSALYLVSGGGKWSFDGLISKRV